MTQQVSGTVQVGAPIKGNRAMRRAIEKTARSSAGRTLLGNTIGTTAAMSQAIKAMNERITKIEQALLRKGIMQQELPTSEGGVLLAKGQRVKEGAELPEGFHKT
jgi:hypothetical protein